MTLGEKERNLSAPELLSPAGDWDSLVAAVVNGADAVYLGTKEFNARIHARNFSLQELERAVRYCHSRGVRVYLVLNTLVKNSELSRYFGILSKAYALGIDGVIIQHISFLEIIKSNFPDLRVFISTQAAVGNVSSASLLKSAARIILPRELPLVEVKKIIDSSVKVEVFVHGALCFSYSGLCLFSSFASNRSGNRGMCAQMCRQRYNNSYPLSTRELCLVRRIPELIQAGISGFKIEGRMRSPLYVAVATRLYRKAIDSFLAGRFVVPEKEMAEIEVVFNREFTKGFLFGDKDLISPEKPMNRGAFLGVIEGNGIVLQRPVAVGDGVGIWQGGEVSGAIIRKIMMKGKEVGSASAGERVSLGILAKSGAKIYLTSSTQISIEPDFVIEKPPVTPPKRREVEVTLPRFVLRRAPGLKFLVKVYSLKEAREASRAGADVVFYDIFAPDFSDRDEWREGASFGAYLPRIINDQELSRALDLIERKRPDAILVGNLGFLSRRREFDVPVYLDYSLNAFNDIDLLYFKRFNVTPLLSLELSLDELAEFKDKDVVIFCHGDIVLVNTKIELKERGLRDEKGFVFPIRKEDSYWQILNSRSFGMFNDIRKLRDFGFSQFFIDQQGRSAYFVELYRKILEQEIADRRLRKGYTAGHLYRPVG